MYLLQNLQDSQYHDKLKSLWLQKLHWLLSVTQNIVSINRES